MNMLEPSVQLCFDAKILFKGSAANSEKIMEEI